MVQMFLTNDRATWSSVTVVFLWLSWALTVGSLFRQHSSCGWSHSLAPATGWWQGLSHPAHACGWGASAPWSGYTVWNSSVQTGNLPWFPFSIAYLGGTSTSYLFLSYFWQSFIWWLFHVFWGCGWSYRPFNTKITVTECLCSQLHTLLFVITDWILCVCVYCVHA